jgi:hypothetical protein
MLADWPNVIPQATIGNHQFSRRRVSMSAENAKDDIVRLATAANSLQAHIWEQALQEAGIRCKAVGDFLDAGLGDIPGVSAEVWVHRDDLARAEEILRQGQEVSDAESVDESEP